MGAVGQAVLELEQSSTSQESSVLSHPTLTDAELQAQRVRIRQVSICFMTCKHAGDLPSFNSLKQPGVIIFKHFSTHLLMCLEHPADEALSCDVTWFASTHPPKA